jgi:hypothetical protein
MTAPTAAGFASLIQATRALGAGLWIGLGSTASLMTDIAVLSIEVAFQTGVSLATIKKYQRMERVGQMIKGTPQHWTPLDYWPRYQIAKDEDAAWDHCKPLPECGCGQNQDRLTPEQKKGTIDDNTRLMLAWDSRPEMPYNYSDTHHRYFKTYIDKTKSEFLGSAQFHLQTCLDSGMNKCQCMYHICKGAYNMPYKYCQENTTTPFTTTTS